MRNAWNRSGLAKPGLAKSGLALCCAVAAMMLSGCKGFFTAVTTTPPTTGTTTYLYVTNPASTGTTGSLSSFSVSSTGAITALSGSPLALAVAPTSIVVAPNNAFLYVGTTTGIFEYTIGTGGVLTEANNSTVVYLNQAAPSVKSMAVDSTNSWLLIAYNNSSELDAVQISPTTGLPVTGTPEAISLNGTTPQQILISPDNTNVFLAMGTGGFEAVGFTAAPTTTPWGSKLVTVPVLKTNGQDNALAVDTTSAYVFVAEATTNQVRMISIADLTTETDYATGAGPNAILPDKTGAYVYVSNGTDGTISGFSLTTTGTASLTALTGSPFVSSKTPVALAEDTTKTYVFSVGSSTTPNLYEYTFDATTAGKLDQATTGTTSGPPSLSNGLAVTH